MKIGDSPSFLPQLISFSGLFNTHFNHKFVFFLPTLHKIDFRNSSYLSFNHKKWEEKNTKDYNFFMGKHKGFSYKKLIVNVF